MMKALQPPNSFHLQTAQGWCELYAFDEADTELDKISASLRAHPKVLEVRWQIYANLEKWAGALEIASAIVKQGPDWPSGWFYRATSLTELNRQQEAYETLSAAAALFPGDEIIPYDLACVCCALKRPDEAKRGWAKPLTRAGTKSNGGRWTTQTWSRSGKRLARFEYEVPAR